MTSSQRHDNPLKSRLRPLDIHGTGPRDKLMNSSYPRKMTTRRTQVGAITMISAVLILILLTEMVIYAVQTGVFEQRKSSNELRQKQAFHIADSAIQQAKQFMLVNAREVSQAAPGGWLAAGTTKRWLPCAGITDTSHPCFAESNTNLRNGSYYYSFADATTSDDKFLPLKPTDLGLDIAGGETPNPNEQVELYALLCMLDLDRSMDPVVQGCTTTAAEQDERYFMVTLAARGEADCDNNGDNCNAEALISEKIGSFGPGGNEGGPGVPLTARTSVELSGTVEIVPNPNGGGIGVPISTWLNANPDPACNAPTDPADPVSGSWLTCERHEWYGVAEFPDDYQCPTANCSCSPTEDKLLSYRQGSDVNLGIDVVIDPGFPCDLFAYTFGIPKSKWQDVRDLADAEHQISDCSTLDENSAGFYWVSGADCDIATNQVVGSVDDPVFLVSAEDTAIHGVLFGVLFVTDAENPNVEFKGNGHGTVYGAAIMEADMKQFNGTFQIVYVDAIVGGAFDTPLFGGVQGGWTDFHASWK